MKVAILSFVLNLLRNLETLRKKILLLNIFWLKNALMTTLTYSPMWTMHRRKCVLFSGMASKTKDIKVDGGPFLQKNMTFFVTIKNGEKGTPYPTILFVFFTRHFFPSSFFPVLWVR